MVEKDLWKRCVLSQEWKREGVIHSESGDDDDDGDDELM